MVLQKSLDLGGELFALFAQLTDVGGGHGGDLLDGLGAGHGNALLADGVEQVVDDAATASEPRTFVPFAHAAAGAPHAARPSVMFEQHQRGLAHDAAALESPFERGVICSSRLRSRSACRLHSQARSSSKPESTLSRAMVSSSLLQSRSVSGSSWAALRIAEPGR